MGLRSLLVLEISPHFLFAVGSLLSFLLVLQPRSDHLLLLQSVSRIPKAFLDRTLPWYFGTAHLFWLFLLRALSLCSALAWKAVQCAVLVLGDLLSFVKVQEGPPASSQQSETDSVLSSPLLALVVESPPLVSAEQLPLQWELETPAEETPEMGGVWKKTIQKEGVGVCCLVYSTCSTND